jgi:Skp family chaperone for outer membrane proteins
MSDEPTGTPATGTPVTPTPAIGTSNVGATPTKLPTIEELSAQIEELKRHAANKEEQANRHGKSLSAAEKKLAEYEAKEQAVRDAQLSEAEKANKARAELEQRNQQLQKQLVASKVREAAMALGIINPKIAAAAIEAELEYGDDGMPTNLDESLKRLVKENPYLVPVKVEAPPEPAQSVPAATNAPPIPAMSPGRSTIVPPGTIKPGAYPRLDQLLK